MKFLEVEVKTALIVHGFDDENKEIIEKVDEKDYVRKLVSVERIQSISEQYLLVTSSHGRVMYWEYDGSLNEIKTKLKSLGVTVV